MTIWAYRSFPLLAGMLTTVIIVGCESASAVAVTTGPTAATMAKCQPVLGASSNVGAAGGPSAVSITTQPECGWTASTQASWITDLSPSSGQGSGQLAFRAAPNTEPSAREADILVNNDRVRVVQEAAPPCIFEVRPGNLNIGAAGGTTHAAVSVRDRCPWGASSSVVWISVASGANGSGSGSSTFRVAPNAGATRSGDVTVASQTFTVTQSAAAAGPSGGGGAGPASGDNDEDDINDDGGDDNSGKDKGKDKDKDTGGKGKDTL